MEYYVYSGHKMPTPLPPRVAAHSLVPMPSPNPHQKQRSRGESGGGWNLLTRGGGPDTRWRTRQICTTTCGHRLADPLQARKYRTPAVRVHLFSIFRQMNSLHLFHRALCGGDVRILARRSNQYHRKCHQTDGMSQRQSSSFLQIIFAERCNRDIITTQALRHAFGVFFL